MKNKSIIITISVISVLTMIGVVFWFVKNKQIDKKKNITNQEINKKSVDINRYAEKLPPVAYNKVNYPVKETYTYKFNDYSIKVDIPEGFEYFIIKKPRGAKPIKSTNITDSCEKHDGICSGPNTGYWVNPRVDSDDSLCVMMSDVRAKLTDKKSCGSYGLMISPEISKYTGISISDILENTVDMNFNSKKVNDNMVFFVSDSRGSFFSQIVISDKQFITTSASYDGKNSKISRDLYFSILDSIKLKD